MSLKLLLDITINFLSSVITSAALEFVFPPAEKKPTIEEEWVQGLFGLVQLTTFIYIAPTLSYWINPEQAFDQFSGGNLVYVFGYFMQPNMMAKLTNWYNGLNLPTGECLTGNCQNSNKKE